MLYKDVVNTLMSCQTDKSVQIPIREFVKITGRGPGSFFFMPAFVEIRFELNPYDKGY
jgi:hypothetical protein